MSLDHAQEPLQGKTYTLRLDASDSDAYYRRIASLVDGLLQLHSDPVQLLAYLRELSKNRRRLRKLVTTGPPSDDHALILRLKDELSEFTSSVESHLKGLRFSDRWDRTLATTEEQYHLYMLEIELTNRIFSAQFRASERRLAFLPHCLRDLSADCLAAQRDLDYVCKGCTNECNVNQVSKALRRHGIKPYIWMTANLRTLFRRMNKNGESLGVLGIACIPELVRGMRMCQKYGIPVVGIPLDANRCARWWGEFHWNSINFKMLVSLL
jgi:hypothetical protein